MKLTKVTAQLLIGIVFLCCAAVSAQAETVEIEIKNFNFYPPDPVIDVGDTVVWTNKMNYGHWVISGVDMRHDNKFFSYLLLNGTKFSYTFRTPGDYPYYCPIHSMQAMISVVGAAPSDDKPAAEEGGTKKRRRRR